MVQENTNHSGMVANKPVLPNSITVLVLGIMSIVLCCYGIGIILGTIALALSIQPQKLYVENPEKWSGYGNLQAGKITAIIGVSLSALFLILMIIGLMSEGIDFQRDIWKEFQL
jgi:hypothetical protein